MLHSSRLAKQDLSTHELGHSMKGEEVRRGPHCSICEIAQGSGGTVMGRRFQLGSTRFCPEINFAVVLPNFFLVLFTFYALLIPSIQLSTLNCLCIRRSSEHLIIHSLTNGRTLPIFTPRRPQEGSWCIQHEHLRIEALRVSSLQAVFGPDRTSLLSLNLLLSLAEPFCWFIPA